MNNDPMIAAVLAGHTHWAVAVRPRWEENLVESRTRLLDHVERSFQGDTRFNNLTLAAPGQYCFVMEYYTVAIYPQGEKQVIPLDRYLLPVCDFSAHVAKVNVPDQNPIQIH